MAHDDEPSAIFPTVVGRPKNLGGVMVGQDAKDHFVGDEALAKRRILKLKSPIEAGRVQNWGDFEKVLHHAFYTELRKTPEEHSLMFSCSPSADPEERVKILEILFETFSVHRSFLATSQALSLVGIGHTNGIVLDCGLDVTQCVAVRDGRVIPNGAGQIELGGALVDQYLIGLFGERGFEMTTPVERMQVKNLKETLCYISGDFEEELLRFEATGVDDVEFELPDGSTLSILSERFRGPEILFQPSMASKWRDDWTTPVRSRWNRVLYFRSRPLPSDEGVGIQQLVLDTVSGVEPENPFESDLWQNVVVCGGSSLFRGFSNRMSSELTKLGVSTSLKVTAPEKRCSLSWLGGAALSKMSSFAESWISLKEFEEFGSAIVAKKCF